MRIRILFVGNSHTYFNYMPQMLAHLVAAESHGVDLVVDQVTGEGAGLAWHWQNEHSRNSIETRHWDFVVLQDRSGGPLEEPQSLVRHAGLLHALVQQQDAQTILFLTWANRSRPETQAAIADLYRKTARDLRAKLAPVGLAWESVNKLDPGLRLHHHDGRHANPVGSYLAACVFYCVLFARSPEGLPGSFYYKKKSWLDLDQGTAALLQKTAWQTVKTMESEIA